MDLENILLDEIALEGLDGITIPTLFKRLSQVKDVPFDFNDESVQEYVWKSIVSILNRSPQHLQLYLLKNQRGPFTLYDKYQSQRSFVFHEDSEDVPKDIYLPLAPVEGKPERGSCIDYAKRTKVTEIIRKNPLSIRELLEKYNESLVIVASQELRSRSLGLCGQDPGVVMSEKIYCFLERVGRMRFLGLSTVGKEGTLKVMEKEKSGGQERLVNRTVKSKDAFYFRTIILKKKLIKASPFIVRINNQTVKGHALFLTRFYNRPLTPLENVAIQTSSYLEQQPDQESDIIIMIDRFPDHSRKAFSHLFGAYPKYFSLFFREFEKVHSGKSHLFGQKVKRKFVKLIKPFSLDEEEDEDETQGNFEDEDETQDEVSESSSFYQPDVILADRTLLSQVLALIETSGDGGLSLQEIGKQLSISRLDARSFVRVLMTTKCIKSVMVDVGKNRLARFLPLVKFEKSKQEFLVADNGLDFKPEFDTLIAAKRANCILDLVGQDLIVTGVVPFRKRILELEKDRGIEIDRTSVKTLIHKLASKKKLRTEVVVMERNGQKLETLFVMSNQLPADSPVIADRINQWKFQMAGVGMQRDQKPVKRGHLLSRDPDQDVGSEALTYQPSIGRKYGAEPKLVKALTLYRFLHHLLYVLPQDQGSEYDDWRKHVRPLSEIDIGPACKLGEVAVRLPLSVFVRVVYLTHVVPGLEEFLNDQEKCHLPVSDLPEDIRSGLTYRRKYLQSLYEGSKILQQMNLAEVDFKMIDSKESAKIILKNTFSFTDKGEELVYDLKTSEDVEEFLDDLRAHCTSTCSDCSLPPQIFAHNIRNWIDSPKPRLLPSLDSCNKKLLAMTNEIFLIKPDQLRTRKRPTNEKIAESRKRRRVEDEVASHEVVPDENIDTLVRNDDEKEESSTPKKRIRHDDDVDIEAVKLLKSRRNRSNWTEEEDSFLILARTASLLLDPSCHHSLCVPARVVRDELHKKFNHSRDKTSKAIQRRIIFLGYKDGVTKSKINEWVVELRQEDDFFGIRRPDVPRTNEDEWTEAYLGVFNKLTEKYQLPFTSAFKPSSETSLEPIGSIDDYVVKEASVNSVLVPPPFVEPKTQLMSTCSWYITSSCQH